MNRTARTNDRYSRTRTGGHSGSGSSGGGYGERFRSSSAPARSSGRSGGGRRPAAVQGEFALPVSTTPALPAVSAFAELDMPEPLMAALTAQGMAVPFPIQAATLPNSLAGRDVLGRGRTGSGKTYAFCLPLVTRLAASAPAGGRRKRNSPRGLILAPTRELARQIDETLAPLAKAMGLKTTVIFGGVSQGRQVSALDQGVDIVVACPGRLEDLMGQKHCRMDSIEVSVLDEADHMADMGFLPSVTRILDDCRPGGQRLLFSATLDRGVGDLVAAYMSDPVTHSTDEASASVSTMEHHLMLIEPNIKKQITARIASRPGRTVVFARTKLGCERIAGELREAGVAAAPLHGGLSQSQRNKTIGAFRTGSLPVLVATDVAARGIHVDDVSLVMQVDPPGDHKDYLHRAGRTARAGEKGSVVTLVLPHQRKEVTRMAAEAGLEARPVRTELDHEVLSDVGAVEPSGVPISDADFRKLVDPRPARRHSGTRGPRGARDHRDGGRGGRQGGYRGRPRD
ncbi:MAG TPA: DEAD/DEAH box helicase [Streptomyces sp.]|nr:DEAD/DEAH box helicase [Streptomyces sp.]